MDVFGVEQSKVPPKSSTLQTDSVPIAVVHEDKGSAAVMPQDKQLNGDVYPPIVLGPPGSQSLQDQASTPKENDNEAEEATAESKQADDTKKGSGVKEKVEKELSGFEKAAKEATPAGVTLAESLLLNDKKHAG